MKKPLELYSRRKIKYNTLIEKYSRAINIISNLRLLVFLLGLGVLIFLYAIRYYYILAGAFLLFIFLFVYLIVKHQRITNNKRYAVLIHEINDKSLQRLAGEWKSFSDEGEAFLDVNHRFSGDLDIYGKSSLFQWINMTVTNTGRQRLGNMLAEPLQSIEEINIRQESIRELAERTGWRQRFNAEGVIASSEAHDVEPLLEWAEQKNSFVFNMWVTIILRILPLVTLLTLLAYVVFKIPYYIPVLALAAHFLLLKLNYKERIRDFNLAIKYKDDIRAYDRMLGKLEKGIFGSLHLNKLKSRLSSPQKHTASRQVNELVRITDSISDRYNIFYFAFNLLTLWDYQCQIALMNWKKRSGVNIRGWFEVIGEMEALSSLAIIGCDHPDWAIPKFTENAPALHAKEMGHPLLGNTCVCNDLTVKLPSGILLVTGSNMSGKSTLLRSAGVNLILAYAGAPVFAREFTCSIMEVYTCMRVSDNLGKSISSFYAELLRIRMIIEAVRDGKQIFFLLDEIFKGTNSKDRHSGAKILIKKLSKKNALGLVSTHDLELGDLEAESGGRIVNCHFREYYRDNKLYFDYKLQPGVSTTRNAVYLMKMAGIDMDEEDG